MSNWFALLTAVALLSGATYAQGSSAEASASLRITQRALVAMCVNDAPVKPSERRWSVGPDDVRLTVTMRNEPRYPDREHGAAGRAAISFRAEPGHRYEVEVRADRESFSRRVWTAGRWTPVVRDRTTEQIVSSTPDWSPAECRSE